MKTIFTISFMLMVVILHGQCPDPTFEITSAVASEATCGDDGEILINASGGSGQYEYRVDGLTTTSYSNANPVTGLSAANGGTDYEVFVRDQITGCEISLSDVNLPSTYVPLGPLMGDVIQPACPGETGDVQLSIEDGVEDFTYTIVSGPGTAPDNSDGSFTDLPEGDYRFDVTDACGVVRTIDLTIEATDDGLPVIRRVNNDFNSATCMVDWELLDGPGGTEPFMYQICDENGNSLTGAPQPTNVLPLPPPTDNTTYIYKKIDACGRVGTFERTQNVDIFPNILQDCSNGQTEFVISALSSIRFLPITLEILDAGGNVVATVVTNTNGQTIIGSVPAGDYTIRATDTNGCGTLIEREITVEDTGPFAPTSVTPDISFCEEGSGQITLDQPGSLDGIATAAMYEIITTDNASLATPFPLDQPINNSGTIILDNVPEGTHTIRVIDPNGCGETEFEVTIGDTLDFELIAEVIPGCASSQIQANQTITGSDFSVTYTLLDSAGMVIATNANGSFVNLTDGDYTVETLIERTRAPFCEFEFSESLSITALELPDLSGSRGVVCTPGSTFDSVLTVDASLGVPPYQYQIKPIGTPIGSFTPLQNSPQFTNLAAGTYDVRVFDVCGQSAVSTVTIEELSPPQITTASEVCVGEEVVLEADIIAGATYTWTLPDGSSTDGDSLTIPDFQSADLGTYSVTIEIDGCFIEIVDFDTTAIACAALPVKLAFFSADLLGNNTVNILWQTASEVNNGLFVVEHSRNGIDWNDIFNQPGAGDSSTPIDYSYLHTNPVVGTNHYRLRQIDFDGTTDYSSIQTVEVFSGTSIQLVRNPISSGSTFFLNNVGEQINSVFLIDLNGSLISDYGSVGENATKEFTTGDLSRGLYILQCIKENEIINLKLVIQ